MTDLMGWCAVVHGKLKYKGMLSSSGDYTAGSLEIQPERDHWRCNLYIVTKRDGPLISLRIDQKTIKGVFRKPDRVTLELNSGYTIYLIADSSEFSNLACVQEMLVNISEGDAEPNNNNSAEVTRHSTSNNTSQDTKSTNPTVQRMTDLKGWYTVRGMIKYSGMGSSSGPYKAGSLEMKPEGDHWICNIYYATTRNRPLLSFRLDQRAIKCVIRRPDKVVLDLSTGLNIFLIADQTDLFNLQHVQQLLASIKCGAEPNNNNSVEVTRYSTSNNTSQDTKSTSPSSVTGKPDLRTQCVVVHGRVKYKGLGFSSGDYEVGSLELQPEGDHWICNIVNKSDEPLVSLRLDRKSIKGIVKKPDRVIFDLVSGYNIYLIADSADISNLQRVQTILGNIREGASDLLNESTKKENGRFSPSPAPVSPYPKFPSEAVVTMPGNKSLTKRMEEELACAVCCELFTQPRLLQCSHTFCKKCIQDLLRNNNDESWRYGSMTSGFSCPICRTYINLKTARGISDLPENLVLSNLIQMLKENGGENLCPSTKQIPPLAEKDCKAHPGAILSLFCLDCSKSLCPTCARVCHQHRLMPVKALWDKTWRHVHNLMTEVGERMSSINDRVQLLNDTLKGVDEQEGLAKNDLKAEVEILRSMLLSRLATLNQEVHSEICGVKYPILQEREMCTNLLATLEEVNLSLGGLQHSQDDTKTDKKIQMLVEFESTLTGLMTTRVPQLLSRPIPVVTMPSWKLLRESTETAVKSLVVKRTGPFPSQSVHRVGVTAPKPDKNGALSTDKIKKMTPAPTLSKPNLAFAASGTSAKNWTFQNPSNKNPFDVSSSSHLVAKPARRLVGSGASNTLASGNSSSRDSASRNASEKVSLEFGPLMNQLKTLELTAKNWDKHTHKMVKSEKENENKFHGYGTTLPKSFKFPETHAEASSQTLGAVGSVLNTAGSFFNTAASTGNLYQFNSGTSNLANTSTNKPLAGKGIHATKKSSTKSKAPSTSSSLDSLLSKQDHGDRAKSGSGFSFNPPQLSQGTIAGGFKFNPQPKENDAKTAGFNFPSPQPAKAFTPQTNLESSGFSFNPPQATAAGFSSAPSGIIASTSMARSRFNFVPTGQGTSVTSPFSGFGLNHGITDEKKEAPFYNQTPVSQQTGFSFGLNSSAQNRQPGFELKQTQESSVSNPLAGFRLNLKTENQDSPSVNQTPFSQTPSLLSQEAFASNPSSNQPGVSSVQNQSSFSQPSSTGPVPSDRTTLCDTTGPSTTVTMATDLESLPNKVTSSTSSTPISAAATEVEPPTVTMTTAATEVEPKLIPESDPSLRSMDSLITPFGVRDCGEAVSHVASVVDVQTSGREEKRGPQKNEVVFKDLRAGDDIKITNDELERDNEERDTMNSQPVEVNKISNHDSVSSEEKAVSSSDISISDESDDARFFDAMSSPESLEKHVDQCKNEKAKAMTSSITELSKLETNMNNSSDSQPVEAFILETKRNSSSENLPADTNRTQYISTDTAVEPAEGLNIKLPISLTTAIGSTPIQPNLLVQQPTDSMPDRQHATPRQTDTSRLEATDDGLVSVTLVTEENQDEKVDFVLPQSCISETYTDTILGAPYQIMTTSATSQQSHIVAPEMMPSAESTINSASAVPQGFTFSLTPSSGASNVSNIMSTQSPVIASAVPGQQGLGHTAPSTQSPVVSPAVFGKSFEAVAPSTQTPVVLGQQATQSPVIASTALGQQATQSPVIASTVLGQQATQSPVVASTALGQQATQSPVIASTALGQQATQSPVIASTAFGRQATQSPVIASAVFGQSPGAIATSSYFAFSPSVPSTASVSSTSSRSTPKESSSSVQPSNPNHGQSFQFGPSSNLFSFGTGSTTTSSSNQGNMSEPSKSSKSSFLFGKTSIDFAASGFPFGSPSNKNVQESEKEPPKLKFGFL